MPGLIIKKRSPLVKLYLLSPLLKLLLALAVFIVISTLGFLILKQQAAQKIIRATQKKAQLEKEVVAEAKNYGESLFLSKNIKTAQQQYELLIKAFPPEGKTGELLASITKLGTTDGLKFIYFKPQNPVNHVFYAAVPVEISVVGQFHQIALFLSGIANLPNSVVAVNQLSLTHVNDSESLLSLEFTATLYHTLPTSMEIKT